MCLITGEKPTALFGQLPAAMRDVRTAQGRVALDGQKATGVTKFEEALVSLSKVMPVSSEEDLKARQGLYCTVLPWNLYVVLGR
jgi:hypothetical protein